MYVSFKRRLVFCICLGWTAFSMGGISAFALFYQVFYPQVPPSPWPDLEAPAEPPAESLAESALHGGEPHLSLTQTEEPRDRILEAYRDPLLRPGVEAFFSALTGSSLIAAEILRRAEEAELPPALAFALAWEESRYNPRALSPRNPNGSVDRGLFQLNSLSFPELREEDFFDPGTNISYGVAHLRWCLEAGGSELVALAIYNAGSVRINTDQAPRKTLSYASRILELKHRIEAAFQRHQAMQGGRS